MKPYYEDEAVKLYNADSLDLLPLLPMVDLVATDPPYGISFQSNARKEKFDRIANDDVVIADELMPLLAETLMPGGACYVATRWDVFEQWRQATADAGLIVKNCIVWAKPGGGMGDLKGDYAPTHEFFVYAVKGRHLLRGKRISNVWDIKKDPSSSYIHPTQKPVELLARIIEKSSDPGQLVLDPFAGSGSTLVAAKQTGRRAIGVELSEEYAEKIANRLTSTPYNSHSETAAA